MLVNLSYCRMLVGLLLLPQLVQAETTGTALETRVTSDGVRIEKMADGLVFPEGPVWHPDGYLIFSDIQDHKIMRLKPEGGAEPWISFDPPRQTNGMILSNDRKTVYACGHGKLEFLGIDAKSREIKVLSADADGRPYANMNDVAMSTAGQLYFTDPKWGETSGIIQGIYWHNPQDDSTTRVAVLDQQPNGIVISPDQKYLYVARTGGNDIWRYELQLDGSLAPGAKWIDLPPKAAPDGMCIDTAGYLYLAHAGDGAVQVISPEGKTLRTVKVFDRMCTNVEFEGAGPGSIGDGKVLYATGGGGRPAQRSGAVYKLTFPN